MAKVETEVLDDTEEVVETPVVDDTTEDLDSGKTRDQLRDDAFGEAEQNAKITALLGDEEPTAENLRSALGELAEGLTDEELLAEWAKAVAKQETPVEGSEVVEEEAPAFALPNGLKLYGEDGNPVTDLSKLTLVDLFSGKLQWGYNALGKEQKRTLADVFRNASLGHYNEKRMAELAGDRQTIYQRLTELQKEHEVWGKDRQLWSNVLAAAAAGNVEPLNKVIKEYAAAAGNMPAEAPDTSAQDAEYEAAGQQFILTTVVPFSQQMATEYGANQQEILQAFLDLVQQEPADMLTEQRVKDIMEYEIPALIENAGYSRNGAGKEEAPKVDPNEERIAKLEAKIQELTATKANTRTQRLRERKAPPAGGGSTPSAGETMPDFKSRDEYKRWMRGES